MATGVSSPAIRDVTMTFHKLAAGSGYEYLTRQVAALDSTEKHSTPLADCYSAKGEAPGRWVGTGLVGVDGLEVGDVVKAEQMKLLFGTGAHPLTGEQLGATYVEYRSEAVDEFNREVARRISTTGATTTPPRLPSSSTPLPAPAKTQNASSTSPSPANPSRSTTPPRLSPTGSRN